MMVAVGNHISCIAEPAKFDPVCFFCKKTFLVQDFLKCICFPFICLKKNLSHSFRTQNIFRNLLCKFFFGAATAGDVEFFGFFFEIFFFVGKKVFFDIWISGSFFFQLKLCHFLFNKWIQIVIRKFSHD